MSGLHSFIDRFQIVKQIPIFSKLNWFDLQRIARKSVLSEYKKGEVIRHEGDPPDYFYCLISGRVQAYSNAHKGKKENVEYIHRGVHFGIISLLTGENHTLNYEAFNDSIILKIDKNDFHAILKTIPDLGVELSQSLSQRMRSQIKGSKKIFESTIISVYSPSKGTGSSTYAINLALSLVEETKKKIIFVTITSRQIGAAGLTAADESSPKWKNEPHDLNELAADHDKIKACIIPGSSGLDFLNVSFDQNDPLIRKTIGFFVSSLVGNYHYVVVDLPNEMDEVVTETLTQSDLVHLLTLDKTSDLELIRHVIDELQNKLKESFREEKIKVIIRAVHDRIFLSFETINQAIDYAVYTNLPLIDRSQLQETTESNAFTFLRCAKESEYARALKRVAREIGGVRVGLVLGGGAALGVAHIGVIRVLEQENIPVDLVVGSSMGALIASMWAIGNDSAHLEAIAREFEHKSQLAKLFDPVIPISGLIGGRLIKLWLRKHLGSSTFYGAKIPLRIVAYDLIKREEIVIDSGNLVEAVRKSIAIPGVIEPVIEGDKVIIDGGVLNPLPTNILVSRGIKKIIAVNVLQSPEDIAAGFVIAKQNLAERFKIPFRQHPFTYMMVRAGFMFNKMFNPNISDIIVRTLQATEFVISEQTGQQADVVVRPDLVGINWYELSKVDELIKRGEQAARVHLPEIKKLIES